MDYHHICITLIERGDARHLAEHRRGHALSLDQLALQDGEPSRRRVRVTSETPRCLLSSPITASAAGIPPSITSDSAASMRSASELTEARPPGGQLLVYRLDRGVEHVIGHGIHHDRVGCHVYRKYAATLA